LALEVRSWRASVGTDPPLPRRPLQSVAYALVAGDSQMLGGLGASSYQRAITQGCAAGEAIQSVNPDGTVVCGQTTDPSLNTLARAPLVCGAGEVAKFNGTAWACAPDIDTDTHADWGTLAGIPAGFADGTDDGLLAETDPSVNALGKATLSCTAGQVPKFNGTAWACAVDLNTGTQVPAGALMVFNLAACPAGWIEANGAGGTPYLRGAFVRGWDHGRGLDPGRALGSYQADIFGSHTHLQEALANYISSGVPYGPGAPNLPGRPAGGSVLDTRIKPAGGVETRPKNVALLYCMKQ